MNIIQKASVLAVVLVLVVLVPFAKEAFADRMPEPWPPDRPWEVIDLAIALDTSGSMQPLIDAVSLKLWDIVHDVARLKPTPIFRMALLTYGNSNYDAKNGRVRVETDFTEDFDLVSERLFALTTGQGGAEYVGRILKLALDGLSWTPSDETLKLIIVAGNESAEQDPKVKLDDMARIALDRDTFILAVYCGSEEEERAKSWRRLAELAEGQFAAINLRSRALTVKTPYDEELAELSETINDTYIPLGEEGRQRYKNLAEQDQNARKLSPEAVASRSQVKTTRLYCAGWDLVDALDAGRVNLYDLKADELPEYLRAMSFEELELYIDEMRKMRNELQEQIAEIAEMRRQYVDAKIASMGAAQSMTFDTSVRRVILEKASQKGFRLPER
jgi:hypothetical protein